VTSTPASRSAVAVPPVERISTPSAASALPKSATPVLSETEIRARRTRIAPFPPAAPLVAAAVSLEVSAAVSLIDRPPCAGSRHRS